jgi:hypothetical protein
MMPTAILAASVLTIVGNIQLARRWILILKKKKKKKKKKKRDGVSADVIYRKLKTFSKKSLL